MLPSNQQAVTAFLKSKQLLPFGFACLQSQQAVSAYLKSKQLLPFGFAEQHTADSRDPVGGLPLRVRCLIQYTARSGLESARRGTFRAGGSRDHWNLHSVHQMR